MSQWINVLDELPDCEADIVFVELVANSQCVHHGYFSHDDKWVAFTGCHIKTDHVTHWTYLPELPTKDDCWATRTELLKSKIEGD